MATIRAHEDAFRTSFGDKPQIVELDVPFVTGYEYMRAPELIEPHVMTFLDEPGQQ